MSTISPNIGVESNIWICMEDPNGLGNNVHAAARTMPGDLAFKILIPIADPELIRQAIFDGTITRKQAKEREFFRHFAPYNHLEDPNIAGITNITPINTTPKPSIPSSPWRQDEESTLKSSGKMLAGAYNSLTADESEPLAITDLELISKSIDLTDSKTALDHLSRKLWDEIERIGVEGADAMKTGDWGTAKSMVSFAEKLETFARNVDTLINEWGSIAQQHEKENPLVKDILGKGLFGNTTSPSSSCYL